MKKLLIVVGSKNDLIHLSESKKLLTKAKIQFDIEILSAHRNIKTLVEKLDPKKLEKESIGVILAIAHSVSNLPAIIAGYTKDTSIPVIGVGITKTESDTLESLFSVLSIPKGIPLVNTGVNEVGLHNATLFCIKILQR
jgi:5-(carboxyamino)imidazole ribonucleotide mutase